MIIISLRKLCPNKTFTSPSKLYTISIILRDLEVQIRIISLVLVIERVTVNKMLQTFDKIKSVICLHCFGIWLQ